MVLDPVLRSSSGAALLDAEGTALLRERLLGVVGWVTPNLDELALLTGVEVRRKEQVPAAAERLARQAASAGNPDMAIVVTGGHLDRPDDYLLLAARESGCQANGWRRAPPMGRDVRFRARCLPNWCWGGRAARR